MSSRTIYRDFDDIDAQWSRETTMDTEAAKRLDLARIEALMVVLWPVAMNGKTYAIDRIVMLMQHKAKLLGLEAPLKREDTHRIEVMTIVQGIAESAGLDPEEIVAEAERYIKAAQ